MCDILINFACPKVQFSTYSPAPDINHCSRGDLVRGHYGCKLYRSMSVVAPLRLLELGNDTYAEIDAMTMNAIIDQGTDR